MITIGGSPISEMPSAPGFSPDAAQREAFETMQKSRSTYAYGTPDQLIFELKLRGATVYAARELARSGMGFRVFRDSVANPDYWTRTDEGGFLLKPGVSPADAIRDIYRHGFLYGTECATAMVVVYYRAMLDVTTDERFNRLFPSIYLYNWERLDRDLAIRQYRSPADELPGDAKYFINPDVDPLHPEWQGENAFYLGNGKYYGHGIGVTDAAHIIRALNNSRREGATRGAYLLDEAKRQDYEKVRAAV
jgi:protein-glutamine gamma-glutamyltransferase